MCIYLRRLYNAEVDVQICNVIQCLLLLGMLVSLLAVAAFVLSLDLIKNVNRE